MNFVEQLKNKVLGGGEVNREEALGLMDAPLEALSQAGYQAHEVDTTDFYH